MQSRTQGKLYLTSPAFQHGDRIPPRYTCDGENISPPLEIRNLPKYTESLVIIVEDPDAPRGIWTHWLVWNVPPSNLIEEGEVPGIQGTNDFGKLHYGGPCPPQGTHHYYFKVYALDVMLNIKEGTGKQGLLRVLGPHVLATGELMGVYNRYNVMMA
jgi:Raf kinase inhibitor-like YbhB/YbcL family protein